MEFDGKVAIVTGATSGIGMATTLRFAEQGARVAAVGRKKDVLAKVARQNVKTYAVDLTSEQETAAFVKQALDDFGGIDILVNAAGIIANGTVENTTLPDYDLMMNINVRCVFQLMQLALPSIIERKGNIVNVSSVTRRFRVLHQQSRRRSAHSLRRARAGAQGRSRERHQSRRRADKSASEFRNERRELRGLRRTQQDHASSGPHRATRRDRRLDPVPGVVQGGVDHRRDLLH